MEDYKQVVVSLLGLVGLGFAGTWIRYRQIDEGLPTFLMVMFLGAFLLSFIAGCKLQLLLTHEPILVLGKPVSIPKEWLRFPSHQWTVAEIAEVESWRIPITNDGIAADRVVIMVESVSPALPTSPGLTPVLTLHKPNRHSEDHFTLVSGETAFVDFISSSGTFSGGAFWVANATAQDGYVYYEDEIASPEWRDFRVVASAGRCKSVNIYSVYCVPGFIDVMERADRLKQESEFDERLRTGNLSDDEKLVLGLNTSDQPAAGTNTPPST